jgi:ribonucleotide reductase beta subunit family protein with ferritin-like domain/glutaredoxin
MRKAVVLSKEGCVWCVKAKALLDAKGIHFDEVECADRAEMKMHLAAMRFPVGSPPLGAPPPDADFSTFPQIILDGTLVGGYTQLAAALTAENEFLLTPNPQRFSVFPITCPDMWELYKRAVASFWTVDEVSLAQDLQDWAGLSDNERTFVKHVLAFFASSDGIIQENLAQNFLTEIQVPEARQFFSYQIFNESVHGEQYGILIDSLVEDVRERATLFEAIATMPAVAKKAEWAMKWLDPAAAAFAERLLAFVCVEGILFSGSFCAIYWLKTRGLMPGLGLSNQFISRDEALHCEFGALLYRKYLALKLTNERAHAIVREAVDNEKEFIIEALPCSLLGMNAELMAQYIEFVADRLLETLGHPKLFNAENPFPFMELISLSGKDNFFEKFASEYQKAGVMTAVEDQVFGLDAEF